MRLRHFWTGLSRTALAGVGIAASVGIIGAHLINSPAARAAAGDVVLTGPDQGAAPHVRTFLGDGTVSDVSFYAAGTETSGASVASGDVTGDGVPDIITGTGRGPAAQVQIRQKNGQSQIASVNPFPGFIGGVRVAAANVDDDAALEVIVAAGPGGGPHVKAFNLTSGDLVEAFGFFAYGENFHGGVFVGGAPGKIITGPGLGGGPHVRVWSVAAGVATVSAEWFAYDPAFSGGVRVAGGQVRGDAVDVVTGAGPGGGPHVKLYGLDGVEGPDRMVYDEAFGGGVFVGVGAEKRLITGAGVGGGPHVEV
ncbi:MAG: hypothetical protein QOF21_973, partial [Actinomycetota bacterium]